MGSVRGAGRRSTSTEQQRQNPSGRNLRLLCKCKMCFDIGIATCGPNEALVISGMFQGGKPTFISGGRAIVCPCIQTVQRIPLNTMIGEAEARRDATIAEAHAEEQRMEAKLKNDTEIARSKRDFELNKATYDTEVNTAKAEAEMAYGLQEAKVRSKIKEEEMQVKVVERQQNIAIQEQEIMRKEKELDSKVKKPAEAEKYRLEKIAEADKQRIVLEAEAESEAKALKGEAEAYTIEVKAKAEAEQMAKKADAWQEYKEAALVDMMLKVLPKIAAEVSAPHSQVDKITMVGDGDGPIGASKVTGEVLDIMNSLPAMVQNMTGVDIKQRMAKA